MFVIPVNPNSINVPLFQTGCCKSEFDSTYPIHLNGIIRQDEFQQSIENINRTFSSRIPLIISGFISFICILGGMVLFIVGGATAASSARRGFPVLVGVGIGAFLLGMLVLAIGCPIIQSRRAIRMRQVVAIESMKYSARLPTPCSWRLYVSGTRFGGYGNRRRNQVFYRLVIEIGHPVVPGSEHVPYQFNHVAPQSTSFFPQQNNMPPPPPYYDQSAAGFCSQCGMPRQNLTAKFCSSCGQPVNF